MIEIHYIGISSYKCGKSTMLVDLFDKIKYFEKIMWQIFPCGKIKCHKLSTLVIGRTLTRWPSNSCHPCILSNDGLL